MKKRTYKRLIRALEGDLYALRQRVREHHKRHCDLSARFRTKCNDVLELQDDKRKMAEQFALRGQEIAAMKLENDRLNHQIKGLVGSIAESLEGIKGADQQEKMELLEKQQEWYESTIKQLKDTIDKLRHEN